MAICQWTKNNQPFADCEEVWEYTVIHRIINFTDLPCLTTRYHDLAFIVTLSTTNLSFCSLPVLTHLIPTLSPFDLLPYPFTIAHLLPHSFTNSLSPTHPFSTKLKPAYSVTNNIYLHIQVLLATISIAV